MADFGRVAAPQLEAPSGIDTLRTKSHCGGSRGVRVDSASKIPGADRSQGAGAYAQRFQARSPNARLAGKVDRTRIRPLSRRHLQDTPYNLSIERLACFKYFSNSVQLRSSKRNLILVSFRGIQRRWVRCGAVADLGSVVPTLGWTDSCLSSFVSNENRGSSCRNSD